MSLKGDRQALLRRSNGVSNFEQFSEPSLLKMVSKVNHASIGLYGTPKRSASLHRR